MSSLNIKELSQELQAAISKLDNESTELEQSGVVTRISDGIVWVYGLSNCGFSDVLDIATDNGVVRVFALNLNED